MLFVMGARTAGRIYDSNDQLVSTVFLHLFFIPLIPLKSVRVAEKGFLRDTGELAPLVGKSVWAAYLRHALLAVLGVGFAMAFSGLFLNDVVERDKPALVAIGTGVFAGASLAWLWASFVLGARATPSRFAESAGGRFSAGVAALVLVLTGMFAAARFVPRPLTLEVIAADRTRGDEEALRAMAKLLYPAAPRIDTARDASGITLSITVTQPRTAFTADFPGVRAAELTKAAAMLPLRCNAADLVTHGAARQLSRLTISLQAAPPETGARLAAPELYRISIPRDKFAAFLAAGCASDEHRVTRETLLSAEKIFTDAGVVEADNFPLPAAPSK